MERRERTRRLIELGGLLQKSGLPDLANDDWATIYGALLDLADIARGPKGEHERALWRSRGRRTFEAEAPTRSPPSDFRGFRPRPSGDPS